MDERLAELYAQVPAMKNCRGLCADSCGPIEASVREREKLRLESGRPLDAPCGHCTYLTPLGRCSVYDSRPMICRLFGTTPGLRCEHGCEPERWLTDEEGFTLISESLIAGGPPEGLTVDPLRRMIGSPKLLAQVVAIQRALRLVPAMRQPLGDALESIEGTREEATRPEASGGSRGRSRRK